ncbi:choline transport protein [Plectosphaerella plurivora]|uniref:Choline transport protein n=1 Tax=Plectosphaerella plurivora TaxID=936078 RepID=A0A9P9A983_9PEZI|nr:choline transport protein [Plectosphaerella plurivora]
MDSSAAGSAKAEGRTQGDIDAQDLADFGHSQVLTRKFSLWSMLALAFCVLGTWAVFAQNMAAALSTGGPISIFWGLLLVLICNVCIAVSLGEMCSSMPTALGQAYWISRLWDTQTGRLVSYICAWTNTFGWWALTASVSAFLTELLLSVKVMFDPEWPGIGQGWTLFLVYLGITLFLNAFNLVACRSDRTLPLFNYIVMAGFIGLFIAISMAMLISVGTKPELKFQPASFVFGAWINQTGWSDGVTWFIGLVQSAYGLTAFDAVIHMVEEIPQPGINAPKAMYLAVIGGAVSGFIFMVAALFSIQDLDTVLEAPSGFPFIQILDDCLGIVGGAVLIALFLLNNLGQGISVMTSSSRLTWGFARDGGLPFSSYFGHVDPTWKVPARALWLQCVIVCLIGVLYTFSTTVLSAVLALSTIALTISYALPIVVLLAVGREKLPPRAFTLGKFGPVANYVSIIYCIITTIFFFFPESPNPTGSDMNYAIVVFGVMLVFSTVFWFVGGRKSYLCTRDSVDRDLQARHAEMDSYDGVPVVQSHKPLAAKSSRVGAEKE